MMSYDPDEFQLKEARELVDVFSSSLNKAREQEGLFEEERLKWVLSFEEKSIMIEQLERELTSTVDALNQEKEEKIMVQKELVKTTLDITNLSQSMDSGIIPKIYLPTENSSLKVRPEYTAEISASNRRVLELLQQSQGETSHARGELSKIRIDRDRLADQATAMKRQMDCIIEERDYLAKSIKNNASKLNFRNDQIAENEREKEMNSRRERDLMEFVASLEKQISSQRSDLSSALADLQAASAQRVSLEQQVQFLVKAAAQKQSAILVNTAATSASALQARFNEMEGIAVELSHRAESAENSLKILMDAGSVRLESTDQIRSLLPGDSIAAIKRDRDSDGLINLQRNKVDHDFVYKTSQQSQQNSTEKQNSSVLSETCDAAYYQNIAARSPCQQFLGSKGRRNPDEVQHQEDPTKYDLMKSQVLEEFYTAAGINQDKKSEASYMPTSISKNGMKKTRVKSTSRSAVENSLMRGRRKRSDSMESDNSRITAILKTAYHLQNLSLGSDHGHTSSNRIENVPKKGTAKRKGGSSIGSHSVTKSTSIPLNARHQNALYLRMMETLTAESSKSTRGSCAVKTSCQSRKILSQKTSDRRHDSVHRNVKHTPIGTTASVTPSYRSATGGGSRTPSATTSSLLKSVPSAYGNPHSLPSSEKAAVGKSKLQVTVPSGRKFKNYDH